MNARYPHTSPSPYHSPLLFKHNTGLHPLVPSNGKQPIAAPYYLKAETSAYRPQIRKPKPYQPQPRYPVRTKSSSCLKSYPYVTARKTSLYTVSPAVYSSAISSKGLSLILIATLILVALDLTVIRPQKVKIQVRKALGSEEMKF